MVATGPVKRPAVPLAAETGHRRRRLRLPRPVNPAPLPELRATSPRARAPATRAITRAKPTERVSKQAILVRRPVMRPGLATLAPRPVNRARRPAMRPGLATPAPRPVNRARQPAPRRAPEIQAARQARRARPAAPKPAAGAGGAGATKRGRQPGRRKE